MDKVVNDNFERVYDLGAGETLDLAVLLFGDADYATNITVNLNGERSAVTLRGLYFASNGQNITNLVTVNHWAANCKSNILYKGALLGDGSRTIWEGTVHIDHKAVDTDTYEENRNLLLGPGTRAESTPNLEILTGEIVKAGHASATGRFDDEQLFYLMSRGIAPNEARKLIARGFFEGVLEQLEIDENERVEIFSQLERKIDGQ